MLHTPAQPLRFGFLPCTSAIASKNYYAVKGSASSSLVAVASRSAERAAAWAAARGELGVAVHGSYAALLADARVDAVYMPLPTSQHGEWVAAAAAAGKHIILEKPAARNAGELAAMAAACARAGVALMDGVMFQHHPRLPRMLAVAASGELGALRRISSSFSFSGDSDFLARNIRVSAAGDPLGCLGDLDWYSARMAQLFFGGLPATARAVAHARTAEGVPLDVTFTLTWPPLGGSGGGDDAAAAAAATAAAAERVAVCDCSFLTAFRQTFELAGSAGTLACADFVIPRSSGAGSRSAFTVTTGAGLADVHRTVTDTVRTEEILDACQEAAMFEAFSRAVLARSGAAAEWTALMLGTQAIIDACMASIDTAGAAVPVVAPAALLGRA